MDEKEIVERLKDAHADRLYGSTEKDQYYRLLNSVEDLIEEISGETPNKTLGIYTD